MTMERFLAVAARGTDIPDHVAARFRATCDASMVEAVRTSPRLMLAASATTPCIASADGELIILGYLHQEGQDRPFVDPSAYDLAEVKTTCGERLTSRYWGSYVALHDRSEEGSLWVLRAPLGHLPCFVVEQPEFIFVGSDVALLLDAAAMRPSVDPAALARFLLADDVRSSETCLSGIRELPGGWRLTIGVDRLGWHEVWSPWEALGRPQLYDRDDAISRVRDAVQHAIGANVSRHSRPLLRLSGGIDSSVVAAAWPRQEQPVDAVTFVTDDASGDERHYARAVAATLGILLQERRRRLADIDPMVSAAAGCPRPSARLFAQASDAMTREVAAALGCDAVVDGGGGDSVFCYAINPRIAADCLLDPDGREHFWPTVRAIAALGSASPITVVRRALGLTWRRRAYTYHQEARFLTPWAIACGSSLVRRWPPPPDALPGKVAHVAGIASIAGAQEDVERLGALVRCSPLLTQPVVEACLRVPTWRWVEGGVNRAAVRDAFADRLPETVLKRRSKGTPDSFLVQIVEAHRDLLRSMLVDGELARMGLVDRGAAAAAFAPAAIALGSNFYRLLRLVDAEAWLRSWQYSNVAS